MMKQLIHLPLPYCSDSSEIFSKLRHLPWSIYLDSCRPECQQGRYDIISACPFMTLVTQDHSTIIRDENKETHSEQDPFHHIKEILGQYPPMSSSFPFTGGALGYFSYDLARYLESLPSKAKKVIDIPEMMMGIYDWAIIVDHHLKSCHIVSGNRHWKTKSLIEKVQALLSQEHKAVNEPFKLTSTWQSNMSRQTYNNAFGQIKNYIDDGTCYQVNLTHCLSASYQGSSWSAYLQLRKNNPASFAAYMNLPDCTIMSLSPERFIQVNENVAQSKPIKGTRPRSDDPQADHVYAQALLASGKDKAENLMIVDLLRNDFGKICIPGSIKVPELFQLQSFPNVHHLVSTIVGKLPSTSHSTDLLRACFPGGSITGAPKYKAMQIIEQLEPQRRAIYCGSLAYIDFNGNLDSNIAIRTLVAKKGKIHCSAGGGIVADSNLEDEYQETLDKIKFIFNFK